ncbi:MAG TPA: ABC transporter permease [Sulfurospirillum sp. UBA11407]|nr:MAG TPA: ABC transporter permease [Sulfurospirillum sp. UBA11407]
MKCNRFAKNSLILGVMSLFILFGVIFAFWIGHFPISFEEYINVLKTSLGLSDNLQNSHAKQILTVLYDIRFPRILAALLIGASLAVSGVVFQGIFINPLVSPGILGVLSGASLGAALAMLWNSSLFIIQTSAFLGGFIAVFFSLGISKFYGRGNTILMLVLGGVISSSLFSALLSLVKYVADPYNTLPTIVYWLMGSLSLVQKEDIFFSMPIMLLSIFGLLVFNKHINLLSVGEDDAKTLGINVNKTRLILIILSTILSALSVMLAGVIGWIGLVIPHIARFIVGLNHSILLPFSAMLGALFLLLVDTLSRGFFAVEVPLGILTSLVGIPIFLVVLNNTTKGN